MIPFDIEKWIAGWKPVTRDGRTDILKGLRINNTIDPFYKLTCDAGISWGIDGKYFNHCNNEWDLFLLPPDEDIVVHVISTTLNGNVITWDGDGVDRLEPGRYKLVKID